MLPALATALAPLTQAPGKVPIEQFRGVTALLMVVVLITVVFATIWLMAARRRARGESARKKQRRGKPTGAWDESARRLRLPPDDGMSDDDTRDIDPDDLSPGDVDWRPDGDGDAPDAGRGTGWRR